MLFDKTSTVFGIYEEGIVSWMRNTEMNTPLIMFQSFTQMPRLKIARSICKTFYEKTLSVEMNKQ